MLPKIKGIIQLDGYPGGEGNYIGVVSRIININGVNNYSDEYDITHLHFCSTRNWATRDCFDSGDYSVGKVDDSFFDNKKWSGHTLEGLHYETMERLVEYLT